MATAFRETPPAAGTPFKRKKSCLRNNSCLRRARLSDAERACRAWLPGPGPDPGSKLLSVRGLGKAARACRSLLATAAFLAAAGAAADSDPLTDEVRRAALAREAHIEYMVMVPMRDGVRLARKSAHRYRHDYEDADHVALLELLKGLPCAVMVSG